MHRHIRSPLAFAFALVAIVALPLSAQDAPTSDPVVQRIYEEGMRSSHAYELAQTLMDSIGPRLTGSPACQ